MEDKEKKIVKSDNEQGNQYHEPAGSPKGGQFTSGPKNGNSSGDDDVGVFEFKEEEKREINLNIDAIYSFLNVKKDQKAKEVLNTIENSFDEQTKSFYNSLSLEEKIELLVNSKQDYDKNILEKSTDLQVQAVLMADGLLNQRVKIEQEIALLNKDKENIEKEINQKILEMKLEHFSDFKPIEGVWWSGARGLEEYELLSAKAEKSQNSELKSSIDLKINYYNEVLKNENSSLEEKAKAFANLKKLDKYIEQGEKYLEFSKQIKAKYVDNFEEIEKNISEKTQALSQFNANSPLLKKCREFLSGYQDKNAAYSQFRKDNAIWITEEWIEQHPEYKGKSIQEAATKYFGDKWQQKWKNLTSQERNQLIEYTGGGYSKYNRPLRGLSHSGWGGWGFAQAVTNMTNALDKCEWEEDMWIQRGIDDSKIFKLPGGKTFNYLSDLTETELQQLVGTSFEDKGFYSGGAGKGTGFEWKTVIFNTYCPKGTKGAYMNIQGHYADSDENEMILQRGYTYRITKVEKKGSRFFIDCEVILGSDKNKVTDMEELYKIGKKHLG